MFNLSLLTHCTVKITSSCATLLFWDYFPTIKALEAALPFDVVTEWQSYSQHFCQHVLQQQNSAYLTSTCFYWQWYTAFIKACNGILHFKRKDDRSMTLNNLQWIQKIYKEVQVLTLSLSNCQKSKYPGSNLLLPKSILHISSTCFYIQYMVLKKSLLEAAEVISSLDYFTLCIKKYKQGASFWMNFLPFANLLLQTNISKITLILFYIYN